MTSSLLLILLAAVLHAADAGVSASTAAVSASTSAVPWQLRKRRRSRISASSTPGPTKPWGPWRVRLRQRPPLLRDPHHQRLERGILTGLGQFLAVLPVEPGPSRSAEFLSGSEVVAATRSSS